MNAEKLDKAIELRNKIDEIKNIIDVNNECYMKLRSLC